MLQYVEVEWQLAQLERNRLIAPRRVGTPLARHVRPGHALRVLWSWRSSYHVGWEVTAYVRSEWIRPVAHVGRVPVSLRSDRLTAFVR